MSFVCNAKTLPTFLRRTHLVTASAIALMAAMPALEAAAAEAQGAQEPLEEIIITGSRIIRNGYEAPTPVTVVGIEQIQDTGKANIADVLNQMPVFQGSSTPTTSSVSNSGKAGGNNLNPPQLGFQTAR